MSVHLWERHTHTHTQIVPKLLHPTRLWHGCKEGWGAQMGAFRMRRSMLLLVKWVSCWQLDGFVYDANIRHYDDHSRHPAPLPISWTLSSLIVCGSRRLRQQQLQVVLLYTAITKALPFLMNDNILGFVRAHIFFLLRHCFLVHQQHCIKCISKYMGQFWYTMSTIYRLLL